MSERRLFFALWPDEGVCRELTQRVAPVVERNRTERAPYLPEDLHLTLTFIGAASETYRACLSQAAGTMAKGKGAFTLEVDRLGYFERGKVLWAGPQTCPAPLAELKGQLDQALSACGYEPESRVFKPHVTLMRKAGRPENLQPFTPVSWRVNGFSLAESLPVTEGRRYRVIEEFDFAV